MWTKNHRTKLLLAPFADNISKALKNNGNYGFKPFSPVPTGEQAPGLTLLINI